MSDYVVLELDAVLAAAPITTVLLRHARYGAYRELARRVAGGEVVAGVPANWLGPAHRLKWSGCLTVTAAGVLRWEPDGASVRTRQAVAREWDAESSSIEVLRRRTGFTGERLERLQITDKDASVTKFVVFGEVGPWHLSLDLDANLRVE